MRGRNMERNVPVNNAEYAKMFSRNINFNYLQSIGSNIVHNEADSGTDSSDYNTLRDNLFIGIDRYTLTSTFIPGKGKIMLCGDWLGEYR